MATKIIPASTILETPDVNVLNDNIIEDVDYSYDTVIESKENLNFTWKLWDITYDQNTYNFSSIDLVSNFNNLYVAWQPDFTYSYESTWQKVEYTSKNCVYQIQIKPDSMKFDNGKIVYPIPLSATSSTMYEQGSLRETNSNVKTSIRTMNCGDYETFISYVNSYRRDFMQPNDFNCLWIGINLDNINNDVITLYIYMPYKMSFEEYERQNNSWVLLGSGETYYLDFSLTTTIDVLDINTVSTGNQSIVSLQSNELIQDNTKIDNTQISSYIADNIKSYYANGKTTMNLLVDYTGDNEYEIGDIVQPMQDVDEPVMKYSDGNPMEFEVTSNQISYNGKGTQNLELVEKVYLKHTITIPDLYDDDNFRIVRFTVKDSNNVSYSNGDEVLDGTQLTITATPVFCTLEGLYVNGSAISSGDTIIASNNIVISARAKVYGSNEKVCQIGNQISTIWNATNVEIKQGYQLRVMFMNGQYPEQGWATYTYSDKEDLYSPGVTESVVIQDMSLTFNFTISESGTTTQFNFYCTNANSAAIGFGDAKVEYITYKIYEA